jgi:hypothetical protein
VDEFVSEVMIARLSRPDALDIFLAPEKSSSDANLHREADQLRKRLDGLAEAYADGTLTASQLRKGSERLRAKLAQVEARLAEDSMIPKAARTVAAASDVRAAWEALDVADQREIIRALAVVHLHSAGRGSRKLRPETVRIEWLS